MRRRTQPNSQPRLNGGDIPTSSYLLHGTIFISYRAKIMLRQVSRHASIYICNSRMLSTSQNIYIEKDNRGHAGTKVAGEVRRGQSVGT